MGSISPPPKRTLNILIAGAGLGGLTTSISLRRSGHHCTILEKSSLSHEIGQGITLACNGSRILRDLGIDFSKARLADFRGSQALSAETGEKKGEVMYCVDYTKKYGIEMMTAYRPDLHKELVRVASEAEGEGEGEPVEIRTGVGIADWDAEGGRVVLQSGEKLSADLIIAADGVKSHAARHIVGPGCPEIDSSEYCVFRFTIATRTILADPEIASLLEAGPGMCAFHVHSSMKRWLVQYYCRDNEIVNFALYSRRSYENAEQQQNELRFSTDRASLLKEMEGFHPVLLKVANMASEVLPLWRCTTREPLRTMHKGRMCVIGDAAHPVLPHLGMGAVSAIEDGAALATLLADLPPDDDLGSVLNERLNVFSEMRVPKVAAYKYYSDVPFFRNPFVEQKAKVLQFADESDLPSSFEELRPWIMRSNAVEEAKDALQRSRDECAAVPERHPI